MRRLLALVLLVTSTAAVAQQRTHVAGTQTPGPHLLEQVKLLSANATLRWIAKTSETRSEHLPRVLKIAAPNSSDRTAARYGTSLVGLFTSINSDYQFFPLGDDGIAASFCTDGGESEFILGPVTTGDELNTLKLDQKQRIARALDDWVLPLLPKLNDSFQKTPVRRYAVMVTYGARDFLNESISDAETVVLVVTATQLRKYSQQEISQEQLLSESVIFLNKSGTDFRRVTP